jgi:hypothetical protein
VVCCGVTVAAGRHRLCRGWARITLPDISTATRLMTQLKGQLVSATVILHMLVVACMSTCIEH